MELAAVSEIKHNTDKYHIQRPMFILTIVNTFIAATEAILWENGKNVLKPSHKSCIISAFKLTFKNVFNRFSKSLYIISKLKTRWTTLSNFSLNQSIFEI